MIFTVRMIFKERLEDLNVAGYLLPCPSFTSISLNSVCH